MSLVHLLDGGAAAPQMLSAPPKRPRGDGRCLTRTGDLRRERPYSSRAGTNVSVKCWKARQVARQRDEAFDRAWLAAAAPRKRGSVVGCVPFHGWLESRGLRCAVPNWCRLWPPRSPRLGLLPPRRLRRLTAPPCSCRP